MLKKTVLALAAVAAIATAGVAGTTPAEAGYWYHGTWFPVMVVPRHYHCHWEWRVREYWHHGHMERVRENVRVCD
ncbi:MAG: hypothetical protein P4L82_23240 [Ancalomicrobiaceae bacterium]|nr:hypothetical protein [Ancalomicrobiaceae bacterium]